MTLPAHTLLSTTPATGSNVIQWPCDSVYFPLRIVAEASLPTRFGEFKILAFSPTPDGKEHIAMVRGNVKGEIPFLCASIQNV